MRYLLGCVVTALTAAVLARVPNYDESKVRSYTLEDPLTFVSGEKLTNPAQWPARRKEILDVFQREMYGQIPPPSEIVLDVSEQGETLCGFAIRKQVRMWFKPDKTGPKVDWLVLLPKHVHQPVPAILFLNYRGNQELLPDEEVRITDGWLRNDPKRFVTNHRIDARSRGALCRPHVPSPFPVGMILARGYAVVTACYGEISPDPTVADGQDPTAYTGVFSLWPPRDPKRTDNTTSLGAWAWTLMRGLDMLMREPAVDANRVVVTGCSRLGKAALLAGAFDARFAAVVACQTGGGGAPLAKRDFGENISTEMKSFTHWYCAAYGKYVDNEDKMPFDQHLLLAAVAPRPLLVLGFDQKWFDTKGEWLACRAASPVWKFLGKAGLPDVPFPADMDTSAVGPALGYIRRPGEHGINDWDWMWLMNFTDYAFRKAPVPY